MSVSIAKAQGEKLMSQYDSPHLTSVKSFDVYKVFPTSNVLLVNKIKSVLTIITMNIYFLQLRLIVNRNTGVGDTCVCNKYNIGILTT